VGGSAPVRGAWVWWCVCALCVGGLSCVRGNFYFIFFFFFCN
jgi:hypothetical protein